jgi:CRISPR-associated protein Csm2
MVKFYNDKRAINPKLFSDDAEKLALEIHESGERARGKNKRTQLRKFYDEVLRLNALTKAESWENVLPYVNMLVAKSAYAEGRGHVTPEFTVFLKESINQVEKPEDMGVFANVFEAFMGFYRRYGN